MPVTPTITNDIDQFTKRPIQAWSVHEKLTPKNKFGMVSSIERFLDAEDSEIIAAGECMKGDHGVGLVREANILMWGPIGRPSQMTEEARRVFVNAVVYMKQFAGAKQTVWRGVYNRSAASDWLKSAKTEDDVNNVLGKEVAQRFGGDKQKLGEFIQQNVGYLYARSGKAKFTLDDDAQSLGIANYDPRILEKSIECLKNPREAAKGQRLLERYTGLKLEGAATWQNWYEQNKAKLYFSEGYGYRFFTGPAGPKPPDTVVAGILEQLPKAETSSVAPVAVNAGAAGYFTFGTQGKAVNDIGGVNTLVVRIKVADEYHIYASAPEGSPYPVTNINVDLPNGFRWVDEWKRPAAQPGPEPGLAEYRGELVFTRQFYATKPNADRGPVKLHGIVSYQACDMEHCLPPTETRFDVDVYIW